ncbi:MAG TPA: DEAD/DEAH box helicase [Candidatus Paceibacterota bacterium]|nr:DEAD/DEAH box helicase [Candidatus Paceibacterota bacterium]HMP19105.1 DEAD/DEAH box helicase [Candidatus Paceibacterota bacterium]HMP85109.1 DEAD/DEAH box helicase [Candidatus Paceibacterota bacterium]
MIFKKDSSSNKNRRNSSSYSFKKASSGSFRKKSDSDNYSKKSSNSFGRSSAPGRFRSFNKNNKRSGGRRFHSSARIDHAKFINKAVITEESEKFIPEHNFLDFQIDSRLKNNISEKGYSIPTPIQDKTIPYILKGVDLVGIAQTGTGKTGAFLIPLINKVLISKSEQIMIIVPTRELATQISDELKSFTKGLYINSVCCVGGISIGPQINSLRNFNNFIIGTPGRIKDLVNRSKIKLENFSTVVLDEADRMLDMGFINDMKFIMSKMSKNRQTLFFSATLSNEVEILIKDFLNSPIRIRVASRITSDHIDQDVVKIDKNSTKFDVLVNLLKQPGFDKILIFGRTKHGVENLSKKLNSLGFKTESIHGNKTQGKRQKALSMFKVDNVKILVATDVAARGLDISGVSHVINYDMPATHEDYIHRIGRTGRAGKAGKALTFID